MNYAINKQDTVRLYNGRAIPAHGMLPPRVPGYDPDRPPYPYDPEKARKLLAEAGYAQGFEVTYTTHKEEMAERLAESIQADLARVGIRVRIRLLSWPAFVTAISRGEPDFALSAWSMDYPDPRSLLETKLHSRMIGSSNDSQYSNPKLDSLLDQARGEQDPELRRQRYQEADQLVFKDCPYIWHYNLLRVELRQPYVKDYRPHPVWWRDLREVSLDGTEGGP
jgi:oligopeptide transport system substrate-binding protein